MRRAGAGGGGRDGIGGGIGGFTRLDVVDDGGYRGVLPFLVACKK